MANQMSRRNSPAQFPSDDTPQVIFGRNPVLEALKSKQQLDLIYLNPDAGGSIVQITALAKEQGVVLKHVTDRKLSDLTGNAVHQGVAATLACAAYVSIDDLLAIAQASGEDPFFILCDEIEDPHNLGAIIRTAEACGAHGLILPKRRSASLNGTVFKTSAGAASWLPCARVPNLAAAIEQLKAAGVWIYGTDAQGELYTGCDLTGPAALVIGSEGFGMGRLIREKCDRLLRLPMLGKINSLNASVAAGIFMYEIRRQRTAKSK